MSDLDSIDSSKNWKTFEEEVAAVYTDLGYKVESNIHIRGKQIDSVAEKIEPGQGLVKLLIEAKSSSTGATNQDIFDLKALFESLRQTEGYTGAVLVAKKFPYSVCQRSKRRHSCLFDNSGRTPTTNPGLSSIPSPHDC